MGFSLNPLHDISIALHAGEHIANKVLHSGEEVAENAAKDFANAMKDAAKDVTHMSPSQIGHTLLDIVGMVPVVGTAANLVNAGWYAAQGDWKDAAWSAAAAIPIEGDVADAAKLGEDAVNLAEDGAEAERVVKGGEQAVNAAKDGERIEGIAKDGAKVSDVRTGQIEYGNSDLSKAAKAYRDKEAIDDERNVAVFEYRADDGSLKTITSASVRGSGGGHAERIIGRELSDKGINPSQVVRIYSELEPCNVPGGYCARFIEREFPQAKVTWSFKYGATPESRAAGMAALKAALKAARQPPLF